MIQWYKGMKKIIKKILVLTSAMFLVMSNLIGVNAQEIKPRSGGIVSTSQSIKSCGSVSTFWRYIDLVETWGKRSNYTVQKSTQISTSSTISVALTANASEQLSAKMGITYGSSVSTSASIGMDFPANSSKYSKLRYRVQMKQCNVTVTITSRYYDTSIGYYTLSNDYSGVVTVPNKSQAYIEVYYQ